MKKKVNTAKALLDDLEGSGYSDEDYVRKKKKILFFFSLPFQG
jgi:hypothetical protein